MVLMTADLNDAQGLTGPVPKDRYVTRIEEGPNGLVVRPRKGDALMMECSLVIEAGEHKDHRIFPPYRVMISGLKEDGTKHNLDRSMQLVNATGIEWTCQLCGYVGGKGNKQLFLDKKSGKYFCPECNKRAQVSYETDDVIGKRVVAVVDIQKALDSEDMLNNVKSVSALM